MFENLVVTNADALTYTLLGTGTTFACTVLGAASVFVFGKKAFAHGAQSDAGASKVETISLGFAAGIMIAAAVWSLLIPAMELAREAGARPWLHATGGFLAGALFLKILDMAMPHLHPGSSTPEGPKTKLHRAQLLFIAITLHNLPEGGAVGLSSGMAAMEMDSLGPASALALAVGIGLQNIPEGAAVAIPMMGLSYSKFKAFLYGAFSGIVEPICGILVCLLLPFFAPAMPFFLAFAAGAMIYVVVEELIPAAHLSEHSDAGTLAVIIGFALMMTMDTMLAS